MHYLDQSEDGKLQGAQAGERCSIHGASHGCQTELSKGSFLVLVLIDFVAVIGSNSISKQGFRVLIFGEHPEDLGRVVREEDGAVLHRASIWQLEELRDLLKIMELDLFTTVFNQCRWGADYRKPTRLITNITSLRERGPQEWPVKDHDNNYVGPLQQCQCGTSKQLVRRKSDSFKPKDVPANVEVL